MRSTRATIHLGNLRHNHALARRLAQGSRVMAVVKANAYGHGLERVGLALADADAFGVATISDAHRLRSAGLSQRIVLLSGFDEARDLAELRALGIETVVHHESQIRMLEVDHGEPVRVWLKIDSGMHRLGLPASSAQVAWERLRNCSSVHPDVVLMTHLASADVPESEQSQWQLATFSAATSALPGLRSVANSPGLLNIPAARADWVRLGGLLYGQSTHAERTGTDYGLKPVMSLDSKLIAINDLLAGEPVGYGGTHRCERPSRIGIAAIGYGDGYPRHAPTGTPVLVRGQRCPTVGRVSMDLLAIDLTELAEVEVGDPVRLWGQGLPVEVVARHAGTIGYELTCGVTRRVLYVEDELI
ncbi:MAG: alanine racemase [Xanthomonadales bacterium]|nr:alanine racemase [Xanthomonadales bacterium]